MPNKITFILHAMHIYSTVYLKRLCACTLSATDLISLNRPINSKHDGEGEG